MSEIKNWDEWFGMCDDLIEPLAEYEEELFDFYGSQYRLAAGEVLKRKHTTDFDGKKDIVPLRTLKNGLIFMGFGGALAFAAMKLTNSILGAMGRHEIFGHVFLFSVLAAVIVFAVLVVPKFIRQKAFIKKLEKIEARLFPMLSYIPEDERSSWALKYFSDEYASSNGNVTLGELESELEGYLEENAPDYVGFSLFSDVPMEEMDFFNDRDVYEASERQKNIPNLPEDIFAKTFKGTANADEALENMIGMSRIKKQMKQLKSRIEFFGKQGGNQSGLNMAFLGSAGTGKALANDTPIPVNDRRGYVDIGKLQVGDEVFDENGMPTKVLGVYPQGKIDAYKVTFEDGTSLVCNDNHIFSVTDMSKKKTTPRVYSDMTVKKMLEEGIIVRDASRWAVPQNGSLVRGDIELPVDPYALGVLIGNGCLTNNPLVVSSDDEDLIKEFASHIECGGYVKNEHNYNWLFYLASPKEIRKNVYQKYVSVKDFLADEIVAPLVNTKSVEKHIPEIYFCGSYEQRLALLQGLMDTDGSVLDNYRINCCFNTNSPKLAEDVQKLASSLGFRCSLKKHKRSDRDNAEYGICFKIPHEDRIKLFRLPRKLNIIKKHLPERANIKFHKDYSKVSIRNIEKLTLKTEMTCIYVDSESHLYQAGTSHIVTHNTTVARIVTHFLFENGLIKEDKCVEVDGSYLKSQYVGQTSARVNAITEYARGGVLFIDEAYTLEDDAGEATGVLLKAMEDYRSSLVVILAGYESNMNRLLASNEGFTSRIKYKIYFDDFTTDELMEIFEFMLGKQSYEIEDEASVMVRKQFDIERQSPSFGNARAVRNTVDLLLDIHADNFQEGELDEEDRFIITVKDAEMFVSQRKEQLQEDRKMTGKEDESIISYAEIKGKVKDGSKDPDKDLEKLIGLPTLKEEVKLMKAEYEFFDGDIQTEGSHMCFVGPPGTGKTSAAKIITGYLYQFGLISENSYIDINGDFLRGSYLGHTGKRTEAVVKYAQGMVLFIDEAYLLSTSEDGDQFGQEAIGVLIDAMEKNRKNFVVIFAGYDREMEVFFDANSGIRSRIKNMFHFEPYNAVELAKIFNLTARQNGFKVEKDVWKPLARYIKSKMNDKHFGNGRFARSLFESLKKAHIYNYSKGIYEKDKKFVITTKDLATFLKK